MGASATQGKLWGAEAEDWAALTEPQDAPLWKAMLASAGVGRGARFLDLGCGAGGASVLAAEHGAQIVGLDVAQALLQIARQRVPHGVFNLGDMEALPYNARTFDVTFASLCLMFAGDPAVALAEMARVTVADGRVTVGIWGRPEECEYGHILRAVAAFLPAAPAAKGPFALSRTGILEGLIERVGLTIVDSGEVDAPFLYADEEMMWRMVRSAGPPQAALQRVGEAQVKAAVARAAEPFRKENGEILLNNRLRYVTAVA